MGLNHDQFRELIVRPALMAIKLHSPAAENLLCGTALAESNLEYLAQAPSQIALSVFQIENATYKDLLRFLSKRIRLLISVELALGMDNLPSSYEYLAGNLTAACIFARLKYLTIKEPLPDANDINALAIYWSKYYQTENKMIDISRFVTRYKAAYL